MAAQGRWGLRLPPRPPRPARPPPSARPRPPASRPTPPPDPTTPAARCRGGTACGSRPVPRLCSHPAPGSQGIASTPRGQRGAPAWRSPCCCSSCQTPPRRLGGGAGAGGAAGHAAWAPLAARGEAAPPTRACGQQLGRPPLAPSPTHTHTHTHTHSLSPPTRTRHPCAHLRWRCSRRTLWARTPCHTAACPSA